METILIWLIIMIVLLLISLKFSEWMIICGIVWILAGLQEIIKFR
jgi:hypothetical protein